MSTIIIDNNDFMELLQLLQSYSHAEELYKNEALPCKPSYLLQISLRRQSDLAKISNKLKNHELYKMRGEI